MSSKLSWKINIVKFDIFNLLICIFVSGAKVRQEIYDAFDNIYPILKSFKKQ